MNTFNFGLVPSLLTPFKDGKIDYRSFEKLIELHIQQKVDGLAIPTHIGESVSITGIERKELFQFAVQTAKGRIPIIGNVSEAGTDLACDLARAAQDAGVSALYACVPYYWTPPESMLLEHFTKIGKAGQLPFFVYNSPEEMSGVKVSTNLVLNLISDLPEFAGIIDMSLDWQYMISAKAIGATGLLSPLANVAPKLVRELYDVCMQEQFQAAYDLQVDAAFLYRLFNQYGISGFKVISQHLGRDLGTPRVPLDQLNSEQVAALLKEWQSCTRVTSEHHGWGV